MLKSEGVISLYSRLSLFNSPVNQFDRPSFINLTTIPLPTNLATAGGGDPAPHQTKLRQILPGGGGGAHTHREQDAADIRTDGKNPVYIPGGMCQTPTFTGTCVSKRIFMKK